MLLRSRSLGFGGGRRNGEIVAATALVATRRARASALSPSRDGEADIVNHMVERLQYRFSAVSKQKWGDCECIHGKLSCRKGQHATRSEGAKIIRAILPSLIRTRTVCVTFSKALIRDKHINFKGAGCNYFLPPCFKVSGGRAKAEVRSPRHETSRRRRRSEEGEEASRPTAERRDRPNLVRTHMQQSDAGRRGGGALQIATIARSLLLRKRSECGTTTTLPAAATKPVSPLFGVSAIPMGAFLPDSKMMD